MQAIQEASKFPNGWVYEVKKEYLGREKVPIEGILGAWKVDSSGKITGDFIPVSDFDKMSN